MVVPNPNMSLSLSCPICLQKYTEMRYPVVAPECAHSICVDCGRERDSGVCVTCNAVSRHGNYRYEGDIEVEIEAGDPWSSRYWKKNFALTDVVIRHAEFAAREAAREIVRKQTEQELQTVREQAEREKTAREQTERELTEIKKKYEEGLPNDIDHLSCSLCLCKERRERMRICVTCAKEKNVELKDKDDKILPFIVCSHCSQEDHAGHEILKYLPWKNKEVLNSVVSYGQSTVASMDEVCRHETDKGIKGLEEWNQQMEVFRIVDDNLPYRECLDIESAVKAEADLVCRASEDTLPKLRMFTKSLEDSKQRLKRLATKMNGEEEPKKEVGDDVVEVPEKKKRSSGTFTN